MRAALDSSVWLATEPHAAHQRNKNALAARKAPPRVAEAYGECVKNAASLVTALRT